MKVGETREINREGLKFTLKALDEYVMLLDMSTPAKRQLGVVISDVPENSFGIKKGTEMLV